jgi:hypothetical protein
MTDPCKHDNFAVIADIHRLTNSETDKTVIAFVAKFMVHCVGCGKAFEFESPREAIRSLDREQLSITIKPSCGVATPFRTRVHIADAPADGKQKCFRCDALLAETGEWYSSDGTKNLHSPFWKVGVYVGISERTDGDPMNPRAFSLMDHDAEGANEIGCNMPF